MTNETTKCRNVCNVIVSENLCVGCGVCVGLCPTNAIKIGWNKHGEYSPVEQSDKCSECGLCLEVCPFWRQKENETTLATREFGHQYEIQHNSVLGFFLELFAGYSKVGSHRSQGAGGGLTTWLLEKMLVEGEVDRVCCVVPQKDPETLFCYSAMKSVDDIRRASRSCYYPVELSQIISEILNIDARYAIVGLPCALKALRLAMLHNAKLNRRIKVMIGLVCGQQKNKFFAEYLCAKAGGQPSRLVNASFRVKDKKRNHLDHRFEFICTSDGEAVKGHIYQSEGMGWLWGHDCFKLNACNFCDDIAAETADVTFGDAVSEPYCFGAEGANFAIVRSAMAVDLLINGASEGELLLKKAPLKTVIDRQKGVILLKRSDLRHRLYIIRKKRDSSSIPVKRFSPQRRLNPFRNRDMELRDQLSITTRTAYANYRGHPDILESVEGAIRYSIVEFNRKTRWLQLLFYIVRIKDSVRYRVRGLAQRLSVFS